MQHTSGMAATPSGDGNTRSTSRPAGQPMHPMLASFSIACFAGAFITDLAYWQTVAVMWESFSDWLIAAGLVLAGFAIMAFVFDLVGGKQTRELAWPSVGYGLAVLLWLVNAFVRSRDAYTAVVPTGLMLSALIVVLMLFTGWGHWAFISRRRVGVSA